MSDEQDDIDKAIAEQKEEEERLKKYERDLDR